MVNFYIFFIMIHSLIFIAASTATDVKIKIDQISFDLRAPSGFRVCSNDARFNNLIARAEKDKLMEIQFQAVNPRSFTPAIHLRDFNVYRDYAKMNLFTGSKCFQVIFNLHDNLPSFFGEYSILFRDTQSQIPFEKPRMNGKIFLNLNQNFVDPSMDIPPRGITNYGNTCFLNSALQVLFRSENFRDLVQNINVYSLQNGNLIRFLQGKIKQWNQNSNELLNMMHITKKFAMFHKDAYRIGEQLDSQEFIMKFFEILDEETKSIEHNMFSKLITGKESILKIHPNKEEVEIIEDGHPEFVNSEFTVINLYPSEYLGYTEKDQVTTQMLFYFL